MIFKSKPLGAVDEANQQLERVNNELTREISARKRVEEELRKHREHLEELVAERTAELRSLVNAMAGREVRMVELKDVVRQLRVQLQEAGLTPGADDPLMTGQAGGGGVKLKENK